MKALYNEFVRRIAMIYTFTFNPSIDYFMKVNEVSLMDAEVNRSSEDIFKVGGKGINVSKTLNELEIDSTAVILSGGFTGQFICDEIDKMKHVKRKSFEVSGNNRINMKLQMLEQTFCINGQGPVIRDNIKSEILAYLTMITSDDWILICGSLAKNMDIHFLIEIAKIIHDRKAKLIVDMELDIETLKKLKPYLIKPNFYEFESLIQKSLTNEQQFKESLQFMIQNGVDNILLSMDKNGAIFANKDHYYQLSQENIKAVHSVGPGDAMLAAFIGKLYSGESIEEALKWGGAAGSAVVSGYKDIDMSTIKDFLNQMKVKKIRGGEFTYESKIRF